MPSIVMAATPWTFWMAPTLLVIVVAATAVVAGRYYRSVMVPAHRLRLREERRQVEQRRSRTGGTVPGPRLAPRGAERRAA